MWDRLKLGYSVASTGVKVIMGRNDMARAAERDQRSLSSLVEKLLTEYCEKIGLIKPPK